MPVIWAVLGAVAGSVANAVVDRQPRRESWFAGRSRCDKCKHKLGVMDLIPVISYLFLGGKCRYCHSPILLRNLIIEVVMALGFVILSHSWSLIVIFWITVVIAVMDWETMLVSDTMVGIWAILVVASQFLISNFKFLNNFYGLLVGVGVIGGLWVLTKKRGMGDGDIGIAAVMGYWLGWPKMAVGLWLAFVIGAAYGLWLMVTGKKTMKSQIPFGPFLIAGAWIGYAWGDKIIKYVFSF